MKEKKKANENGEWIKGKRVRQYYIYIYTYTWDGILLLTVAGEIESRNL